jgi:hypothetical protein
VDCTATLIAPRLVLTARHCKVGFGNAELALGNDAERPRRVVKIVQAWDPPPVVEGGIPADGTDVSVAALAEPVEDVVPIAIADGHLTASAIGKRVGVVGFGLRNRAGDHAVRRAGSVTVRALEGAPFQALFRTEDELLAYASSKVGTLDEGDIRALRDHWDAEVRSGREVYVGQATGDAQQCPGDSGGPLIGKVAGRLVVLAVASRSVKVGDGFDCGVLGGRYATLGRDVHAMIDEARLAIDDRRPTRIDAVLDDTSPVVLPDLSEGCADIPVSGRCNEHALIRCVDASEGPKQLTHTDCSILNQTCVATAAGAECVDR